MNSGNGTGGKERLAHYSRVSTRDKGQDPENQLREIRAEYQKMGFDIAPALEYIDRETGTGKRRRPQFEKMLYDAEHRKFDTLIIWSLDRLSREGTLRTLLILDQLNRYGVKVKSLKEPWLDPTSPTYELLLPIFAWVARQESLRIRQRVQAGLARARAEGVRLGRPPVEVNPQQVSEVYAARKSIRATAKALHVSASTIQRLLKQTKLVSGCEVAPRAAVGM